MLLLLCGVAGATDLPGPGEGELVLGGWLSLEQTFDTRSLPDATVLGGARIGLTDRVSVAFPAVFRVRTAQAGDGELTLVGGLGLLGYSTQRQLITGWTLGVEGRWHLEQADAVAWADVGLNTLPGLADALFDTTTSWSVGVAPVVSLGERWTFTVPLALSGTIGDAEQTISVGVVDPATWSWRTPQTFGGIPVPTVALRLDPRWSLQGWLGGTWSGGEVGVHTFLGVGYAW